MVSLLDLPAELLNLVVEEVGGGELRRDVGNLTICRKWYDAALPIFHSGLHTRSININGCNVNRLSDRGSYSEDRRLMHKNTRRIYIRMLGHWRDQTSDEDFALFADDPNGILYGKQDREALDNDPYVFGERSEWSALHEWQTTVLMPRLEELFGDLRSFTFLEDFTFEAMVGTTTAGQHVHNYLSASRTIDFCFANLPMVPFLRRLTIDLCAGFALDAGTHWCETISQVIPRVADVRLRITPVCADIFYLDDGLSAGDVKVRNLIVKLHVPGIASPRSDLFSPSKCEGRPMLVFDQIMIGAARAYLDSLSQARSRLYSGDQAHPVAHEGSLHGMESFCISFVEEPAHKICIVDCLRLLRCYPQTGWPPEDYLAHSDDGSPCWFEDGSYTERFDPLEFVRPYELVGNCNGWLG